MSFRTPILIVTLLEVGTVGAYLVAVSQRLKGGVTHLGEDTIALVYLSVLVPLLLSTYLFLRHRGASGRDWLGLTAVVASSLVMAGWLYLNLSGSVIGYTEWMMRMKNVPSQAERWTSANRSTEETNQVPSAAGPQR